MEREAIKDIEQNYQILSDSYFTDFHRRGDLQVYCSSVFPDIGWNYAIILGRGRLPKDDEIAFIRKHTKTDAPAFVADAIQRADITQASSKASKSFEDFSTWMTCSALRSEPPPTESIRIFKPKDPAPIEAAVSVFEAAYCSNGFGGIGYSNLGPEYPLGFKKMLQSSSRAHLIASYANSQMVAVASVVFHPTSPLAGLYNVGVHPNFRGQGLGASISRAATQFALRNGAVRCILQTEARSQVALMYSKMGYSENIMTYFIEV